MGVLVYKKVIPSSPFYFWKLFIKLIVLVIRELWRRKTIQDFVAFNCMTAIEDD